MSGHACSSKPSTEIDQNAQRSSGRADIRDNVRFSEKIKAHVLNLKNHGMLWSQMYPNNAFFVKGIDVLYSYRGGFVRRCGGVRNIVWRGTSINQKTCGVELKVVRNRIEINMQ